LTAFKPVTSQAAIENSMPGKAMDIEAAGT
jgi:hypothetical protein